MGKKTRKQVNGKGLIDDNATQLETCSKGTDLLLSSLWLLLH